MSCTQLISELGLNAEDENYILILLSGSWTDRETVVGKHSWFKVDSELESEEPLCCCYFYFFPLFSSLDFPTGRKLALKFCQFLNCFRLDAVPDATWAHEHCGGFSELMMDSRIKKSIVFWDHLIARMN